MTASAAVTTLPLLRKGSVAAFIANAKLLEAADTPEDVRRDAEADLRQLVPVLVDVGASEVFELRPPRIRAPVDEAKTAPGATRRGAGA